MEPGDVLLEHSGKPAGETLREGENLYEQHSNSGVYDSPYRFNGKELDPETGNYYYGARYYNPQVSMWLSVDPMASAHPDLTPYNFVSDNPIMRIDPDGRNDGDYYGKDGSWLFSDGVNDDKAYVQDDNGDKLIGPFGSYSELNVKNSELQKQSATFIKVPLLWNRR